MKTSPTRINFNWQTMKFENLTVKQITVWQELYTGVDVFKTITVDMARWLDKKRTIPSISRKKNWQRFITNWLAREMEKPHHRAGVDGWEEE